MPKRFSERIIEFLRKPGYEPMKARKLARAIGIAEAEYGDFHDAVDALRRVGRVVLGTNNAVMLPHIPGRLVGTYRANPRGFGFVVPDEPASHGDLYIAPHHALDAVTGDKVLCRVLKRGKRGGKMLLGGRIIEVIERGDGRFVGQLRKENGIWYVEPDGNTLHVPILIGDPHARRTRAGDQVVVEITRYPRDGAPARGVIIERLGRRGRPGVDLLGIVRQFHLPDMFTSEVTQETRRIVRAFKPDAAATEREDLSGLTIITIDPDDARDFDDAISLEALSPGESSTTPARKRKKKARRPSTVGAAVWELGVHIADVSAFVPRGSAIDREADARGTSVYLPGQVIPMLPEALSNGLCSLQEDEPRLCKSAFIRYDAKGRVVSARFANTLIRSSKRLTYRQATAILDGKKGRHGRAIAELVRNMETLARLIQKRRLAGGMIVLDLPAVELVLDDDGRVIDARPEDTSFSHTIIEMFMVEANEAAARLLSEIGVPFLRRIHPDPDDESLTAMARFVAAGGIRLRGEIGPRDLQKLLDRLRGKPGGYAVNLSVLKSMQMAEYSPKSIGHFALASENYTHFTSPIRRYPDLMIHRLIEAYLTGRLAQGGKKTRPSDGVPIGEEALFEYGRRMSYLSRRAESAERELKTLKVLTLLQSEIGERFDGVVTGVTHFGLFIQHPRYLIDGLLRLEDLGDDWWEADVRAGRVVGERSRKSFSLGVTILVTITGVDLSSRQLKLGLAEAAVSTRGRGRRSDHRPGAGTKTSKPRAHGPQPRAAPRGRPAQKRSRTQKKTKQKKKMIRHKKEGHNR
ncbi:MAG: ribonuclease R [Phycisphaerae bacterium]